MDRNVLDKNAESDNFIEGLFHIFNYMISGIFLMPRL